MDKKNEKASKNINQAMNAGLTIRIPTDDVLEYIRRLRLLIEEGNPLLGAFLKARIYENENFIPDCYTKRFYIVHFAAKTNRTEILKRLFEVQDFKDYLETTDQNGKTPLQIAIDQKNSEMILYLINNGAKLTMQTVRLILFEKIW